MPTYLAPGIYVEEISGGARPIERVPSSVAAFVGRAPDPRARLNQAVAITNPTQFAQIYIPEGATSTPLSHAVFGFFDNGGSYCYIVNTGDGEIVGTGRKKAGLDLLEARDDVAIVCIPGLTLPQHHAAAIAHCEKMKDRFAILDGPGPEPVDDLARLTQLGTAGGEGENTGYRPADTSYAAFYYPWITVPDKLDPKTLVDVPPSGHIAGIYARTDRTPGVHKAPANVVIQNAVNVTDEVTQSEQELLNPAGVNVIRMIGRGIRVWGARTLSGDPEWRYINVRRLFNQIEESIEQGTYWVVFEPNNVTLWNSIKRDVSNFLRQYWTEGALMGRTEQEAYFVKCDEETNPPESIDAGMVITVVGIAPVKPAEFVIFRISQSTGGAQTQEGGTINA
ncbi:MAG: phage tail sheath family protein [Chloroflexi bacterium]|nr:phage tail sheath family protein [Chloroflexota bacterium]